MCIEEDIVSRGKCVNILEIIATYELGHGHALRHVLLHVSPLDSTFILSMFQQTGHYTYEINGTFSINKQLDNCAMPSVIKRTEIARLV